MFVIPAQAGTQTLGLLYLDPRLRGDDYCLRGDDYCRRGDDYCRRGDVYAFAGMSNKALLSSPYFAPLNPAYQR